jgi:putative membrane protein
VSWFAGLFYIFRLFVYHGQKREHEETCKVFETMERKLIRIIMNPAMILTYTTGIWMLVLRPEWLNMGWIYVKLAAVFAITWYQHLAVSVWKRFAKKDFFLSEKACRMINEIPTVCLIIIVFMVMFKPF